MHFVRRQPPHRTRRDADARRRRPHPYVRARHAHDAGRPRAAGRTGAGRVGVRLAGRALVSLRRADHRRAHDGRVHHHAARAAVHRAADQPGSDRAPGRARLAAVRRARHLGAVRLRQLRARLRGQRDVSAAVPRAEAQAAGPVLRAPAAAALARSDEHPRGHDRPDLSHDLRCWSA